jgi:hypothetical protein
MSNSRPATPINRLASASSVNELDLVPLWSNVNAATRKVTWQKIIDDLKLGSSENPVILNLTSNKTLNADELQTIDILFCDTTAGPFQVSLPSVSELAAGDSIRVKRSDGTNNTLTVMPFGANTIDGDPELTLSGMEYPSVQLITDGSQWYMFNA